MFGNLSGPTLLVILFIVLLLFGAPKLPGLAKSLGQSMKILKKEVRGDEEQKTDEAGSTTAASSAETPAKPEAGNPTAPGGEGQPPGTTENK